MGQPFDSMMPIDGIPDWENRLARADAFWDRAIIDRPVVSITVPKVQRVCPLPPRKTHATLRDRWMDSEYLADNVLAWAMNTDYLGDALPAMYPNLGPEVFSAFFGAELEFGDATSWSVPNLLDWKDAGWVVFSKEKFYWKKLEEMTDALLAKGRNRFYVGLTDIHPGGDAIAAFRDPLRLNLDLLEHPREVRQMLRTVTDAYFQVFDYYCDKLQAAGQAIANWCGIISTRRFYVPSNDFSCMISKRMFDDFFLPGIVEECRHTEASIYHLDGPNALQHLDSLLEVRELNAIQWVAGSGNGSAPDWLHVYKRCQDAGKGLQITISVGELDWLINSLSPEGLWIGLYGVQNKDHAETLLRRIERWK